MSKREILLSFLDIPKETELKVREYVDNNLGEDCQSSQIAYVGYSLPYGKETEIDQEKIVFLNPYKEARYNLYLALKKEFESAPIETYNILKGDTVRYKENNQGEDNGIVVNFEALSMSYSSLINCLKNHKIEDIGVVVKKLNRVRRIKIYQIIKIYR